jgi:hypothetical protein
MGIVVSSFTNLLWNEVCARVEIIPDIQTIKFLPLLVSLTFKLQKIYAYYSAKRSYIQDRPSCPCSFTGEALAGIVT